MSEKKNLASVYDSLSEQYLHSGTLEKCKEFIIKHNNPFLELREFHEAE